MVLAEESLMAALGGHEVKHCNRAEKGRVNKLNVGAEGLLMCTVRDINDLLSPSTCHCPFNCQLN